MAIALERSAVGARRAKRHRLWRRLGHALTYLGLAAALVFFLGPFFWIADHVARRATRTSSRSRRCGSRPSRRSSTTSALFTRSSGARYFTNSLVISTLSMICRAGGQPAHRLLDRPLALRRRAPVDLPARAADAAGHRPHHSDLHRVPDCSASPTTTSGWWSSTPCSTSRSRCGCWSASSAISRWRSRRRPMIDGCSRLRALVQVVVPIIAPGMAVVALFAFIATWNEFLFAIVLTGIETKTMMVLVTSFTSGGTDMFYGEASGLGRARRAARLRGRLHAPALPGQGPGARRHEGLTRNDNKGDFHEDGSGPRPRSRSCSVVSSRSAGSRCRARPAAPGPTKAQTIRAVVNAEFVKYSLTPGRAGPLRQARHQARDRGHPGRRVRGQDAARVQQRPEPVGPRHVRAARTCPTTAGTSSRSSRGSRS